MTPMHDDEFPSGSDGIAPGTDDVDAGADGGESAVTANYLTSDGDIEAGLRPKTDRKSVV